MNLLPDTYEVIGLMSGTSGDGTDIAYCRLSCTQGKWQYEIIDAETVPYDAEKKSLLAGLMTAGAHELMHAHAELGSYYGGLVRRFIDERNIQPTLIASHGHTVFHQPDKKRTFQAGSGSHIAVATGIDTVSDFRALDVSLGGQGAPLVPLGDQLLFGEFDACLNLGGIANISFREEEKRIAYDVCPCNMALNFLAWDAGRDYDDGGEMAASGNLNEALLDHLNGLSYYQKAPPKSLGREFFDEYILPVLSRSKADTAGKLRTVTEHIAMQLSAVPLRAGQSMLITGGGAFNDFLVERVKALGPVGVVIPDEPIVQFKEALIFALLGVLRIRNEINTLSSVTGASRDSSGGIIHKAP